MCVSKKTPSYTAPQVDPAPTTVSSADVGTDQSAAANQRRRRGRSSTELSTDRDTILGASGNTRSTLG